MQWKGDPPKTQSSKHKKDKIRNIVKMCIPWYYYTFSIVTAYVNFMKGRIYMLGKKKKVFIGKSYEMWGTGIWKEVIFLREKKKMVMVLLCFGDSSWHRQGEADYKI